MCTTQFGQLHQPLLLLLSSLAHQTRAVRGLRVGPLVGPCSCTGDGIILAVLMPFTSVPLDFCESRMLSRETGCSGGCKDCFPWSFFCGWQQEGVWLCSGLLGEALFRLGKAASVLDTASYGPSLDCMVVAACGARWPSGGSASDSATFSQNCSTLQRNHSVMQKPKPAKEIVGHCRASLFSSRTSLKGWPCAPCNPVCVAARSVIGSNTRTASVSEALLVSSFFPGVAGKSESLIFTVSKYLLSV